MEEALQPPLAGPPARQNYLAIGVAASLVLHVACTAFLITLPQGSHGSRSVSYIDLSLPQAPAPARTRPAAKPAVNTPLEQETPQPVQKTLLAPETQPAQAQQQKDPQAEPAAENKVEKQVTSTFGLGLSRGFFKSIHDGETLRGDVREYYLAMLDGINNKWWMDKEFEKVRIQPVEVWITVARNGQVLAVQLRRSSGNPRFDKMVLASLGAAGPLPPLPASYEDETFQAPIRLAPPLELMSW
ncbi:MAG TPA: TonB family protein [Geomonas sp.]|nr:TonB family protein [Geomonas sp.]